ncbi:allophanate hydrolase [Salinispirillum marinum]|uniref:Allophanate hydrolase n=2 Tax=Saccharospirillaceae TaxID=255527 RepID=A0ABV8BCK0_9GAMM
MLTTLAWTLPQWQSAYHNGTTPDHLLSALVGHLDPQDPAWISIATPDQLSQQLVELALKLEQSSGDISRLPLYGVPFAVKDNIDVAGFPTTAACPAYAYKPKADAHTVALLKAAGAIVVGKTNLDQFATGLVGTRSPYGAVPNSFKPEYISGGSSSGSASTVARGLVPFSLGTDTAGSGRVPASLNNIIGLKGTCGAMSIRGVVPACRSLDVVSIFALTLDDASMVFELAAQYDAAEAYSRQAPTARPNSFSQGPRLGIPASPQFYGDSVSADAWESTLAQWSDLDVELVPIDFSPFSELAALLYDGPWVAERHAAVEIFMRDHGSEMNPVVRGIIEQAKKFSATDAFKAEYRRAELRRTIEQIMAPLSGLLVPSAPTFPTLADLLEEPVNRNSELGTYTNFVNLADMCALAIPAGFRSDGLPFGVTLIGRAWHDKALQTLAQQWLATQTLTLGATNQSVPASTPISPEVAPGYLRVAVVGAHLTGMPLNSQLTERQAVLVEETLTAPSYRLFALANTTPPKPGLQHVTDGSGKSIIVELWDMPIEHFGSFVGLIPAPLGIGSLTLADGRTVKGFICEGWALADATDITDFGGWRAYLAEKAAEKAKA